MDKLLQLETQLNDFSPILREQALESLITFNMPPSAEQPVVNLHCHTFFSYNAFDYSPTALAWLARQRGFRALGIVDFDVLDGVEEFLGACERLDQRGMAGMETRVFLPEYSSIEINSPGEPGVLYHMGVGFSSSRVPSEVEPILAKLHRQADERNRNLVNLINAYLAPVAVDYSMDILPLTPAGNATERHIITAYQQAASRHFKDPVPFWSEKLHLPTEQVIVLIEETAKFRNTLRGKLMKHGGVGYVQSDSGTFPEIGEVNQLIVACGALPCAAWLDGISAGEQGALELLNLLIEKGIAAINIIPDRNWNVADPETRRLKVQNLHAVLALAQELDLPVLVGTEMNAPGQKLVDDFDVPELSFARQTFLDGANFLYGHTVLQRVAGLGYQSEWAKSFLPLRRQRNAFFIQAGRTITPGQRGMYRLRSLNSDLPPPQILDWLKETFKGTNLFTASTSDLSSQ